MKCQHLILLAISCVLFAACDPKPAADRSFIVLQLNDVYEIAPLEGGKTGGLARVAHLRQELLEENPHVITVLAGDFVNPSLLGTLRMKDGSKIKGRQMIEVLNAMELDLVTFGNHEFDLKEAELEARIFESDFMWICANALHVKNQDTTLFMQTLDSDTLPILPSMQDTLQYADGSSLVVGFVGNVLPFNKADYVAYLDPYQTVIDEVKTLESSCDVVLGLTHQSIEEDKELAALIPQVPLIMGGHEHVNMKHEVGPVTITKADANAKSAYVHRITVTADGQTRVESELVQITDQMPSDPEVEKIVTRWVALGDSSISNMGYDAYHVIAQVPEDTPLDGRETTLRFKQTNYGQLTAQAMLAADDRAQVALFNSGSLRLDDQLSGNVTEFDVLRSFPYGGGIGLCSMSGAELERTLAIGLDTNVGLGGYLQYAGVQGEVGRWLIQGETLKHESIYTVMVTDFMLTGGESNLGYLAELDADQPEAWQDGALKNDIRDLVIRQMGATYPISQQ